MECSETTDSMWVLAVSSCIAFQGIVFALFQSGLARWKYAHTVLLQAFINMVSGSILWYCVGFSLSYGQSQKGFIGNLDNAFFIQVSHVNCSSHAPTVPSMTFATFEIMLASIGPIMVVAAWPQQVAVLGSMIVFLLWPLLVYYPITHWVRGGGWLADMGIVDQAGSLTLHASTGASALVFTRMLRPYVPRIEDDKTSNRGDGGSSQTAALLLVGLYLTWGWFAINVSSGYKLDGTLTLAALNTYLSGCVSAVCWLAVTYVANRTISFVDLLPGFVAGIIGSSATSGSMESWASILTGFLVGVTSSATQFCVRNYRPLWTNGSKFDVTYVHGISGVVGAIIAGLLTKSSLGGGVRNGAFYSDARQLGVQLLGVLMCVVWPALWTYFITWFIHFTVGFNLSSVVAVEDLVCSDLKYGLASVSPIHVVDTAQVFEAVATGEDKKLETLGQKPGVTFGVKNFDKHTPLGIGLEIPATYTFYHKKPLKVEKLMELIRDKEGMLRLLADTFSALNSCYVSQELIFTPRTAGKLRPYQAIKFGHDRVVQCLMRHGAGWAEDGAGDILYTTVAKNDMDELRRLLSLGLEVNTPNTDRRTALHVAAMLGSRGLIQYLIDQGADVNAVDSYGNAPLNYSDMHEHRAVSQLLESLGARRLSHHYSTHEICEAASTGNLQMLRHMVHNGAVICYRDANKRTPLHVSAVEGYLDIVKFLLLQPGIDINARDKNDVTPLLEAVINENYQVAEHLKSHGGAIAVGKLATLVNESARSGDVRCLKRLIRWSGHVNISDHDGKTALHTAVQHGRLNVVTMLLKEGADCNLINRNGKTPLQIACSHHHSAIEKELRRHLKPLEELSRTADSTNNTFYQRTNRKRRRKCRTEPSSYAYSKRESWSSATDNSVEARKQLESGHSVENTHGPGETVNMARVANELNEISNTRPPFFRGAPISSLSPTAREMTGGQPHYV